MSPIGPIRLSWSGILCSASSLLGDTSSIEKEIRGSNNNNNNKVNVDPS